MSLLITLTIASIAGYLRMTVTEEIEAIFAGLVACLCIVLSLIFAPFLLKLTLLAVLLIIRELPDIKSKIMMLASKFIRNSNKRCRAVLGVSPMSYCIKNS